MRPREINCLRHPITSRQALGMMIDCWAEDRMLPVMLITRRNDSLDMVSRIRSALSKERMTLATAAAYGFIVSDPFPCRVNDRMGEAIILRFRMTVSQSLLNHTDYILGGIHS